MMRDARGRALKLLPPFLVVLLTAAAIAGVTLLVQRADASRRAQLGIASATLALTDLQSAPFNADPSAGGSPAAAAAQIRADRRTISERLTFALDSGAPTGTVAGGRADLAAIQPAVNGIYALAVAKGGLTAAGASVPTLQEQLTVRSATLSRVLAGLSRLESARAETARRQAIFGSALAMILLLGVFAFFYLRSISANKTVARLVAEKEDLLGVSRKEATTDALTGLRNRRALSNDLSAAIVQPAGEDELLLAMFDLDGFKQYNDTFGHGAGDALLQRLGARLETTMRGRGRAYRMGGDEFCVLARCAGASAEALLDDALGALHDSGEGWRIDSSHGAAWAPSEAATESDALRLADERMYANKTNRSSVSRQVVDALVQVICEQDKELDAHLSHVAKLSQSVAEALGLSELETQRIRLAAALHDVGKTAIPRSVLDKPGPLSEEEWSFIRRHTLIGERIVLAAPALANTAPLIRSSHEHLDGTGYPDRLRGEEIPLGSRIIAACDAYDAMTSSRPYRQARSSEAALAELERCAGSQFDPRVVDALLRVVASRPSDQDAVVGASAK
jgi:diguanylate cyclase (GGDEF)-like protein